MQTRWSLDQLVRSCSPTNSVWVSGRRLPVAIFFTAFVSKWRQRERVRRNFISTCSLSSLPLSCHSAPAVKNPILLGSVATPSRQQPDHFPRMRLSLALGGDCGFLYAAANACNKVDLSKMTLGMGSSERCGSRDDACRSTQCSF